MSILDPVARGLAEVKADQSTKPADASGAQYWQGPGHTLTPHYVQVAGTAWVLLLTMGMSSVTTCPLLPGVLIMLAVTGVVS